MGRGFKILLIGFLIVSLGFGTLFSMASGNTFALPNNSALVLACLSNNLEAPPPVDGRDSYAVPETLENITDSLRRFQSIMENKQGIINQGLIRWMTKNTTMWMKTLATTSNNQSALQLLIQFLDENPEYQEHFKSYTMALMRYYEALERQNMWEASMVDSHYIVETGEVIEEWNVSYVMDGEPFTVFCKQYSLEINGTTYTAVKAEFYNEKGILIADPDIYVKAPPYYYWYWFPWPWPWGQIIVYGQDDYIYTHFRYTVEIGGITYNETFWYLMDATEECNFDEMVIFAIATAIGGIVGKYNLVAGLIVAVVGAYEYSNIEHLKTTLWQVAFYNGEWGLRTVFRNHYLWGVFPIWDSYNGITFWAINKQGTWVQAFPSPTGGLSLAYCTKWAAEQMALYIAQMGALWGVNQWVWVGPYIPYYYEVPNWP
ncbi:MAG: hypothetical protein QW279_07715 [Candidatus Jordarchaeaceae archaeon]